MKISSSRRARERPVAGEASRLSCLVRVEMLMVFRGIDVCGEVELEIVNELASVADAPMPDPRR